MYTTITYIIRHGKSSFYKIGGTCNLEQRLKGLQAGNPLVLTTDFVIHNRIGYPEDTERHLHCLLDDRFVRGEWYDLPELNADGPEKALLGWLNRLGVKTAAVEQKDNCSFVEITDSTARTYRASKEIRTAILSLLDGHCDKNPPSATIGEIARALPQYYVFEICNNLHLMKDAKLVCRKKIHAHRVEYTLARE